MSRKPTQFTQYMAEQMEMFPPAQLDGEGDRDYISRLIETNLSLQQQNKALRLKIAELAVFANTLEEGPL
jgi:hypothetical protein